jgi:hypothetical protein
LPTCITSGTFVPGGTPVSVKAPEASVTVAAIGVGEIEAAQAESHEMPSVNGPGVVAGT